MEIGLYWGIVIVILVLITSGLFVALKKALTKSD